MNGATVQFVKCPEMISAARIVLLVLAVPLLLASQAFGQRAEEFERSAYNRAAYYNYSETGDVTILVNVWGSVPNPGLYEVPTGTRLGTVLSLAGGPAPGTTSWRERRRTTLRLVRQAGGSEEVAFERVLDDELFVPTENPALQDGDTVTVERFTRELFTWRDALSIVGTGASVALLIDRIVSD